MSREKLREAIERVDDLNEAAQCHLDIKTVEAIERTVAAARAYACERCGGDGRLYNDFGTYYAECRECAEFRVIADGEE